MKQSDGFLDAEVELVEPQTAIVMAALEPVVEVEPEADFTVDPGAAGNVEPEAFIKDETAIKLDMLAAENADAIFTGCSKPVDEIEPEAVDEVEPETSDKVDPESAVTVNPEAAVENNAETSVGQIAVEAVAAVNQVAAFDLANVHDESIENLDTISADLETDEISIEKKSIIDAVEVEIKAGTATEVSTATNYIVLKSWDFDGLEVELVFKPSRKIQSDEVTNDEDDTIKDEGDDASTVNLDEHDISERNLEVFSEETAATTEAVSKLEAINEEVPTNVEAEEGYEGAVGLWGQDYQLPCFKAKSIVQPNRAPMYNHIEIPNFDWIYKAQVPVSAPIASYRVEVPQKCSTMEALLKAEDESVNFTKEIADCGICKRAIDIGRGVILKGCLHTFCRRCLTSAIENNDTAVMKCPSKLVQCESEVRDEEIKALLTPEAYDKFTIEMLYKMNVIETTELFNEYEFVENKNEFRCEICINTCKPGEGITLKDCLHQYCKPDLSRYIETFDGAFPMSCPFRDDDGLKCVGKIMDTEMRGLISPESYRGLLDKSLAQGKAECGASAYQCKTPDCPAWVEIVDPVDSYNCPACHATNCIKCKAIHQGISCEDYYDMQHGDERKARELRATENQVRGLIDAKEAQNCPRCGIVVQRYAGCRHMTCTACRHEFQWTGVDLN